MGMRKHAGLAVATAAMLAVTACGGSGDTADKNTGKADAGAAGASSTYDAKRLKAALLTTYEQARQAEPAGSGTVGALQDRLGLGKRLTEIKTSKPSCLTAGPNLTSPTLRKVPASATAITDKRRGYTLGEVLYSTDAKSLRELVDRPIPASCRHVTAKVKNATIKLGIRPIRMPKAAYPARGVATTVESGGKAQKTLTMMFASPKYGGSLSLSGPRASAELLRQATAKAISAADRSLR